MDGKNNQPQLVFTVDIETEKQNVQYMANDFQFQQLSWKIENKLRENIKPKPNQ